MKINSHCWLRTALQRLQCVFIILWKYSNKHRTAAAALIRGRRLLTFPPHVRRLLTFPPHVRRLIEGGAYSSKYGGSYQVASSKNKQIEKNGNKSATAKMVDLKYFEARMVLSSVNQFKIYLGPKRETLIKGLYFMHMHVSSMLEITAGQRTMSGQKWVSSGQMFG